MQRIALTLLLTFMLAGGASAQLSRKEKVRDSFDLPDVRLSVQIDPAGSYLPDAVGQDFDPRLLPELAQREKQRPTDPRLPFMQANILDFHGKTGEAGPLFEKTRTLLDSALANGAQAGELLAIRGQLIASSGKLDEAEKQLWDAAKLFPREWRIQAVLGKVLFLKSLAKLKLEGSHACIPVLIGALGGRGPTSLSDIASALHEQFPTSSQIREAVQVKDAASRAFDRAVQLGQDAPDACRLRIYYRHLSRMVAGLCARLSALSRSDRENLSRIDVALREARIPFALSMLEPENLADERLAAERTRDSPHAWHYAWKYVQAAERALAQQERGTNPGSELPKRKHYTALIGFRESAVRNLEAMAAEPSRRLTVPALEVLALLQNEWGEPEAAILTLKDALRRAPESWSTAKLLTVFQFQARRHEEAAEQLRPWLTGKYANQARLVFARLRYRTDRSDEVKEHIRAVIRAEPMNATAHLLMAAILGKQKDPDALTEADEHRQRAERIQDAPVEDRMYLAYLSCVLLALQGLPEEALKRTERSLMQMPQYLPLHRLKATLEN